VLIQYTEYLYCKDNLNPIPDCGRLIVRLFHR